MAPLRRADDVLWLGDGEVFFCAVLAVVEVDVLVLEVLEVVLEAVTVAVAVPLVVLVPLRLAGAPSVFTFIAPFQPSLLTADLCEPLCR